MEKGAELGGQITQAVKAPNREELGGIVRHLSKQLVRLGVDVRLNTEATKDVILSENPDAVVLATGALPGQPPFAINGATPVLTDIEMFDGQDPADQNVALLDLDCHFRGGSVAETLAERNNLVRVITPAFYAGADIDFGSLILLRQRLAAKGVSYIPNSVITEVNDGSVTVLDVLAGEVQTLDGIDSVVVAGNNRANNALYKELKGVIDELHALGDCVSPRHIEMAIYEGENIARFL
jgi:hypothetical protein